MKNKLKAKTKSEKKKKNEKLKNRNKLIFFLRIFFYAGKVIVHTLM